MMGVGAPDQFVVAVMPLRPLITSCQATICNPANANAHTEVERNAMHLLLVAESLLVRMNMEMMTQFAPVEPQSND